MNQAEQALHLADKLNHAKIVIENLQGVQGQFIKSQEKKNEQIEKLRCLVRLAYEEGLVDSDIGIWCWSNSDARAELDKMFPPKEE